MTQTAGRTAWYVEGRFDEFVRSLNGSSSAQLLALRKEAMDAFVTGLPHGARRRWRYTSLATLLRQDFGVVEKLGEEALSDVDAWRVPNLQSHVIVFVDGQYQPALSGGVTARRRARQ